MTHCPNCRKVFRSGAWEAHCKPSTAQQCKPPKISLAKVLPLCERELESLQAELAADYLPLRPREWMVRLLATVRAAASDSA